MRCDLVVSVPTAPTTPTLKELSNALDSVVNWFSLGVKLELEDHELRTIERNYRGDGNERCKLEMLSCWLRSGKLPTWKAITDALHLMGEHAAALKIQAKYCSPSTVTTDIAGTYVFMNLWVLGMQRELYRYIERFHVTSLPSGLRRKTENSCYAGVRDRSVCSDLHEMSDILIMHPICVELDKIPSLHKLKQLYKHFPAGFLINIVYTANNILYKLYTKMAVCF